MNNRAHWYFGSAKSFSKAGLGMIEALKMHRLLAGKDYQLLGDAAGQLEQAARELRRLEGYFDGKEGR